MVCETHGHYRLRKELFSAFSTGELRNSERTDLFCTLGCRTDFAGDRIAFNEFVDCMYLRKRSCCRCRSGRRRTRNAAKQAARIRGYRIPVLQRQVRWRIDSWRGAVVSDLEEAGTGVGATAGFEGARDVTVFSLTVIAWLADGVAIAPDAPRTTTLTPPSDTSTK